MTDSGPKSGASRLQLGWLALWLALAAVWLAWAPYQFLLPGSPLIEFYGGRNPVSIFPSTTPSDLLANVVLLAPFGVLVAAIARSRPVLSALIAGALLSVTIEAGQLFITDRIVSAADVVLNGGGGAAAAALFIAMRRHVGRDRLIGSMIVLVFLTFAGYILYAGQAFERDQRLEDWDGSFRIAAGMEANGDMPYVGRVWGARICAGDGPERVCAHPGAGAELRNLLAMTAQRTQVVEASANVLSASDDQTGPTRIVTFSPHAWLTNVTICQWRTTLNVRFRTPLMGSNGERYELWLADAIHAGQPVSVRTRFDHGKVTTWITGDGVDRTAVHRFGPLTAAVILSGPMLGVGQADLMSARSFTSLLVLIPLLLGLTVRSRSRRRE